MGVIGGEIDGRRKEMRMRTKVEGKSRVEAFDPRRFKGRGDLIEGDFAVGVVDSLPPPSSAMRERGGNRRATEEAVRRRKTRAWFRMTTILVGSGAAVLGVAAAAVLFDGGRLESVGAQSSTTSELVAVGAASATPMAPERLAAAGKASVKQGKSERILERFVQWRLKGGGR